MINRFEALRLSNTGNFLKRDQGAKSEKFPNMKIKIIMMAATFTFFHRLKFFRPIMERIIGTGPI